MTPVLNGAETKGTVGPMFTRLAKTHKVQFSEILVQKKRKKGDAFCDNLKEFEFGKHFGEGEEKEEEEEQQQQQ